MVRRGGGIHSAGHVVQVDHDLLLPPGDARLEVEVEDQHQHQFCQAQPAVVAGREPGKQQAGHKEKAEACLCHFGERFLKRLLTHSNTTCTRCPKCNEGKNTIVMIHYTIAHPKNPEEKPFTPPQIEHRLGGVFSGMGLLFFSPPVPHTGKHNPQKQDLPAQVQPQQQNDQRHQRPIHQRQPGGQANEPGEHRRRHHQRQGGDQAAHQHGRPRGCRRGAAKFSTPIKNRKKMQNSGT